MANEYRKNVFDSFRDQMDIERELIIRIGAIGREEVKRRRAAGLSSFFARDGRIIEKLPDNTEHTRDVIHSKWVKIAKGKRSLKLK